jgi:hypothetical protein
LAVGIGLLSFLFAQTMPPEFTGLMAISVVLSMISSKNKTVLTDHTLVLADEGFVEETPYNRTEGKWRGVQKLARTRRHIFIYIAPYMAHVVPRRAFQDDAEWNAFYEFCKQRTQGAEPRR